MFTQFLLVMLLCLMIVSCANPTPTSNPPSTPTDPSPSPATDTSIPSTPMATATTPPPLATIYNLDESHFYTIKQLGEDRVNTMRGTSTTIPKSPIIIEACHVGKSLTIEKEFWVAFSQDGDFDLKNNVILVTGFDSLPKYTVCYEMVVEYQGLERVSVTSVFRTREPQLQKFRLVDGDAIRAQR